jgi:MFS family permease
VITKLRNAYYGWYLLVAAVVGMAIASGVSFWVLGYYVTPLEEEFGWSRTLLQTGISVSLLVSGLASPLAGKVVDRWGPRRSIILGTIFTCGSYLLLATTSTMVEWYLYFSINSFFRGFMFYIPFQVLISRWFERKRGRAVGIMAMGFSLGGFLSPVMQQIIDNVGWDASFIFAAIILAVIFLPLGLFMVRDHPHDMGLEVDGEPAPAGRENGQPRLFSGLTVKQAMKTWNFWVIALAFATFFFAMFGWMFNGTPVYESMGISRETISIILVLQAVGGLISRPTFGLLAERIPSIELASVGLAAIMSLGMFILLILHDSNLTLSIVLFLCCWMIGSAGGPVLEPLILPKTFGLAHFGAIMGTLFMFETIGQFLVPTVGGAIYEITGAYDLLLVVNIGCLGLSMVFFTLAHIIPNPRVSSPIVRVIRPALANLVARTAPLHQFANGARVASNGAGTAPLTTPSEPTGSSEQSRG